VRVDEVQLFAHHEAVDGRLWGQPEPELDLPVEGERKKAMGVGFMPAGPGTGDGEDAHRVAAALQLLPGLDDGGRHAVLGGQVAVGEYADSHVDDALGV